MNTLWSFHRNNLTGYWAVTDGQQTFNMFNKEQALELSAALNAYELMIPLRNEKH